MSEKNTTGSTDGGRVINLDAALPIDLPPVSGDGLKPKRFETPDGRSGWVTSIPGNRPIATPAYDDGLLFVGGGYGSHEFYAFDLHTGELAWQIRTSDDGPTAAVVEDGLVAFNTESCTVIVCDTRTGRVVWEEWLGDPLMSQPAIAHGHLFIAYPADPGKPVVKPGMTTQEKRGIAAEAKARYRGRHQHRLLCADLHNGEHLWEQEITGDVITAPVVEGDQVFVTCLDGVSFCLKADDGTVVWKKRNAGTSSPLVVGDRVIATEKDGDGRQIFERMRRAHRGTGDYRGPHDLRRQRAEYLHTSKGGGSSIKSGFAAAMDASVGFGTAPHSAKLGASAAHLGVSSVSGAWSYQGSRPAYGNGKIFNAQGRKTYSVRDDDEGSTVWDAEVRASRMDMEDQVFLPPALGHEYMYLASVAGHLVSVRQDDGELGMMYGIQHPVAFQPCLAKGRVNCGTRDGLLVSLDTGDGDADDWFMWGGNARHNKTHA